MVEEDLEHDVHFGDKDSKVQVDGEDGHVVPEGPSKQGEGAATSQVCETDSGAPQHAAAMELAVENVEGAAAAQIPKQLASAQVGELVPLPGREHRSQLMLPL